MTKAKTKRQKKPSDQHSASALSQPGGKLGRIIDHLRTPSGATADELAEATGWQKHSVLGALSRLRSRGFAVGLDEVDGRRTYRIEQPES